MSSVDRLYDEAARLPEDQRLTLACRLLASNEPKPTAETENAWETAIRERIARYDAGGARSRPAGEVLAEAGRRLDR